MATPRRRTASAASTATAVAQFDRRIAVEELVEAAQRVASAAGSLTQMGAMTTDELQTYRQRPTSPDDVTGLSAEMIRLQARGTRELALELENRVSIAQRLQQAEAVAPPARRRKSAAR